MGTEINGTAINITVQPNGKLTQKLGSHYGSGTHLNLDTRLSPHGVKLERHYPGGVSLQRFKGSSFNDTVVTRGNNTQDKEMFYFQDYGGAGEDTFRYLEGDRFDFSVVGGPGSDTIEISDQIKNSEFFIYDQDMETEAIEGYRDYLPDTVKLTGNGWKEQKMTWDEYQDYGGSDVKYVNANGTRVYIDLGTMENIEKNVPRSN